MKQFTGLRTLGMLAIAGLLVGGCGKKTTEPSVEDTTIGGLSDPDRPSGALSNDDQFVNPDGAVNPPIIDPVLEDPADGVLVGRDPDFGAGHLNDPSRDLFDPVYFGFNQSTLSSEERLKVEKLANFMISNQNASVIVEGHCDWKGTTEYNIALGERRATSVKQFLLDYGVSPQRVSVSSQGDLLAQEDADTSQMALDRKARFILNEG